MKRVCACVSAGHALRESTDPVAEGEAPVFIVLRALDQMLVFQELSNVVVNDGACEVCQEL